MPKPLSKLEPVQFTSLRVDNKPSRLSKVIASIAAATFFACTMILLEWTKWPTVIGTVITFTIAEFIVDMLQKKLWRKKSEQEASDGVVTAEPPRDEMIAAWNEILSVDPPAQWVVFSYGTCVLFAKSVQDPASEAATLLEPFGLDHIGTSRADFNVRTLEDNRGFVIGCDEPRIFTYVSPTLDWGQSSGVVAPGSIGRMNRWLDAHFLNIIHVGSPSE